MLALGGVADTPQAGVEQARRALAAGLAFETFVELVEAQGGDLAFLDDPDRLMGAPVAKVEAPSDVAGVVTAIDALALGHAAVALGAGRQKKEDAVDPQAGYVLLKTVGDAVAPGEPLAYVYASDPARADAGAVLRAFAFGPAAPPPAARVLDRFDGARWMHGDLA
jgi:pyrimidine-nucleoside phosphorylase